MAIPKSRRPGKGIRLTKYLYLMPATIVVVGVIGYPILRAILLSFYQYNPLGSSMTYTGLGNYIKVLQDRVFHQAIINSVVWTFGNVACQFIFGLLGAILLNQKFKGRGVIRGLTLIPWATPSVLAAMMWMWILDGNYGVLNDILAKLHVISMPIPWISQVYTAMPSLMLIDVWQGVPFFAVMLLAAMQTIPVDLIEAATLDGANPWKAFWKVKFPIILPTIMITTILRIVWTASYMDLMMIVTQGGPAYATLTIPADAYFKAYSDLKYGEATAMAVIQAIALLIVVIVYIRILGKQGILENEKQS